MIGVKSEDVTIFRELEKRTGSRAFKRVHAPIGLDMGLSLPRDWPFHHRGTNRPQAECRTRLAAYELVFTAMEKGRNHWTARGHGERREELSASSQSWQ